MTTTPPPDAKISHADSLAYWNDVSPTVDGMLGGFPQISRIDLKGSANFLARLQKHTLSVASSNKPLARGIDCGAGIGRVTAGFLSKFCEVMDVVEPVEKFAKEIQGMKTIGGVRIDKVYVVGLEQWIPEMEYDLIWNQWCLGHLTDVQLVEYFKRCGTALSDNGWIVVKENLSTNTKGEDVFDELDSSVTRTDRKFRSLFEESGLSIVKTELQPRFPKGLYPVRFYALQPKAWDKG